jgi:hypothetical protein
MDHSLLSQESKCCKELDCEASDKSKRDTLEIVVFDELVEVDTKQLKGDAQMITEVEVIIEVHDIGGVLGVPLSELLQNAHLYKRLMMKPFLVPNDLDSDKRVGFVVFSPDHLTK